MALSRKSCARGACIGIMAIDGIGGSAFAGFNYCWIQPRMATPKAQWSLDAARPVDFYTDWQRLPETEPLRQRIPSPMGAILAPRRRRRSLFPWNLQLQRWQERKWIDVPHVEA
jgi:hypothetical protein